MPVWVFFYFDDMTSILNLVTDTWHTLESACFLAILGNYLKIYGRNITHYWRRATCRGIRCIYRSKRTLRNGNIFAYLQPFIVGAAVGKNTRIALNNCSAAQSCKKKPFYIQFYIAFLCFVLVFGLKKGLSVLPLTAGGIDSLHWGFNCVLKSILNALTRFGQGSEKTIGWRELNIYGLSAAGILAYN